MISWSVFPEYLGWQNKPTRYNANSRKKVFEVKCREIRGNLKENGLNNQIICSSNKKVTGRVSTLCWHATHPSQMLYGNVSSVGKSLKLVQLQNVIKHLWNGNFVLFNIIAYWPKHFLIPVWRFQALHGVFLIEWLNWKSHGPQNKTFIWGASPGIWYPLWEENAKDRRKWNANISLTQERKVIDVEIEIIAFVVKKS